jgi:hypothetical protein
MSFQVGTQRLPRRRSRITVDREKPLEPTPLAPILARASNQFPNQLAFRYKLAEEIFSRLNNEWGKGRSAFHPDQE